MYFSWDWEFSFLWLTLRKSDWNAIIADLSGAKYIYLIPAVLMLLVSHFIRALRWKILMEPLGYKPTTLNTFLAVMIGYWANLAVPRLGEVLKCTILAKYEKVPADKLVGTIVAERAIDVLSLIIINAYHYFFAIQYHRSFFRTNIQQVLYIKNRVIFH